MSGNALYSYDLTAEGDTLPGKAPRHADRRREVGRLPGDVRRQVGHVLGRRHRGRSRGHQPAAPGQLQAGDKDPTDHGCVAIANPDYTPMTDASGKTLPFHGGLITLKDGTVTTRHVILGVSEGLDNNVNILALIPYTLLQVPSPRGP